MNSRTQGRRRFAPPTLGFGNQPLRGRECSLTAIPAMLPVDGTAPSAKTSSNANADSISVGPIKSVRSRSHPDPNGVLSHSPGLAELCEAYPGLHGDNVRTLKGFRPNRTRRPVCRRVPTGRRFRPSTRRPPLTPPRPPESRPPPGPAGQATPPPRLRSANR